MNYQEYLDKIQLQPQAAELFFRLHSRSSDPGFGNRLKESYEAYDRGDEAFGESLKEFAEAEGVTPEEMNLYVYLRMSERTWENYRQRGIDLETFYTNMYAMTCHCQLCYDRHGMYGFDQTAIRYRLRYLLEEKLFRLGRLEFQRNWYDHDITVDGVTAKAGSTVLNVHIPGYQPLTQEGCDRSYAWAREFFRKYYGIEQCVFVCSSWLLHPWMQEVLPETSAILRFQNSFHLLEVRQDVETAIRWIFRGFEDRELSQLPRNTSLQRAAVERIRAGGTIGTAFGARL